MQNPEYRPLLRNCTETIKSVKNDGIGLLGFYALSKNDNDALIPALFSANTPPELRKFITRNIQLAIQNKAEPTIDELRSYPGCNMSEWRLTEIQSLAENPPFNPEKILSIAPAIIKHVVDSNVPLAQIKALWNDCKAPADKSIKGGKDQAHNTTARWAQSTAARQTYIALFDAIMSLPTPEDKKEKQELQAFKKQVFKKWSAGPFKETVKEIKAIAQKSAPKEEIKEALKISLKQSLPDTLYKVIEEEGSIEKFVSKHAENIAKAQKESFNAKNATARHSNFFKGFVINVVENVKSFYYGTEHYREKHAAKDLKHGLKDLVQQEASALKQNPSKGNQR